MTPLRALSPFVSTILSSHESIHAGCLTLDKRIFEPKNLNMALKRRSLATELGHGSSIQANEISEVAELLEAALGDPIDFAFVPTPKPFVIYADHDEYTTFYANTKSNLNAVVHALSAAGYKHVQGYLRDL